MRIRALFLHSLRPAVLLLSALAALTAFAGTAGSGAPPPSLAFDPYIHRLDGAVADPVNLIFLGADADAVAATVHRVLGWSVVDGSPMQFVNGGVQRETLWHLGQDLDRATRLHLRIENVSAAERQGYVIAAVHRDDAAACGHVGGAFNAARGRVAGAFAAFGYPVSAIWLGNTDPGPQCDGSFTQGDGAAVVIDLTNRHLPAR